MVRPVEEPHGQCHSCNGRNKRKEEMLLQVLSYGLLIMLWEDGTKAEGKGPGVSGL